MIINALFNALQRTLFFRNKRAEQTTWLIKLRLGSRAEIFEIHTPLSWPVAAVASEVIVQQAANNAPIFYCSCSMPLTVFPHYHFCMSSEVDFVSARKRNGSSEFGISNWGDELTPAEPSSYEFMRTVVHLHRLCHSLPHRHSFIKTIAGRMEREHQSIN